jgi:geranylgeranyl pyrophosphate synthase
MQYTPFSEDRIARVNQLLDELLPAPSEAPETLHQAMRYVVCQGGKRIRPLLVYATGDALNASLADLDRAACAIELIHAYSLTHDDLPAMDNDDMRRGQPSCHKAFNEATAILVGDALQCLAFDLLSAEDGPNRLAMINTLAKASGSQGMVGGQSLDLAAVDAKIDHEHLELIHHLKTGALIVASIQLGALAAPHCDAHLLQQLTALGHDLGLAYQIQDDIFDGEETSENNTQPCFVSTLGVSACQRLLTQLDKTISAHLSTLSPAMPQLAAIYKSIAARRY